MEPSKQKHKIKGKGAIIQAIQKKIEASVHSKEGGRFSSDRSIAGEDGLAASVLGVRSNGICFSVLGVFFNWELLRGTLGDTGTSTCFLIRSRCFSASIRAAFARSTVAVEAVVGLARLLWAFAKTSRNASGRDRLCRCKPTSAFDMGET
jgi:hypothetical protein